MAAASAAVPATAAAASTAIPAPTIPAAPSAAHHSTAPAAFTAGSDANLIGELIEARAQLAIAAMTERHLRRQLRELRRDMSRRIRHTRREALREGALLGPRGYRHPGFPKGSALYVPGSPFEVDRLTSASPSSASSSDSDAAPKRRKKEKKKKE